MTLPVHQGFEVTTQVGGGFIDAVAPAGIVVGELLYAIYAMEGAGASMQSPPEDGWVNSHDQDGSGFTLRTFWKIATVKDTKGHPYRFSAVASTGDQVCSVHRVSGADGQFNGVPIDILACDVGTSATPTCPGLNTITDDCLVLRLFAADDDDNTLDSGYPAGTTGLYVRSTAESGTSVTAGAAHENQVTAGAVGTAAFTLLASEEWMAVTVAIREPQTVPAGTDVQVRHFHYTLPSGVGNDSFTGMGFVPKALILYGNTATGGGANADVVYFQGMTDGTSSFAMCMWSQDGLQSTHRSAPNESAVISLFDAGNTVVDIAATFVSFDADGFTLNFGTHSGLTGLRMHGIAIGGADADVFAGSTLANVVGAFHNGVGFRTDLMITLGACLPLGGAADDFGLQSTGFVARDRDQGQFNNGAIGHPQANIISYFANDTADQTVKHSTIIENNFSGQLFQGARTWGRRLDHIYGDGFAAGDTGNTDGYYFLAVHLAGLRANVGTFSKTTGGAPASDALPDLGFIPQMFGLMSGGKLDDSVTPATDARVSLGSVSDLASLVQGSVSLHALNSATDDQQREETGNALQILTSADGLLSQFTADALGTTPAPTGTWNPNAATADRVSVWAVEQEPPAGFLDGRARSVVTASGTLGAVVEISAQVTVGANVTGAAAPKDPVELLDAWVTDGTYATQDAAFAVSAGTNRAVLVVIAAEKDGSLEAGPMAITSVSLGDQVLVELFELNVGTVTAFHNLLWVGYLLEDEIAARVGDGLTIVYGNAPNNPFGEPTIHYGSYINVDQTTPIADSDSNTNTSASALALAAPITGVGNDKAVGASISGQPNALTPPTGYTEEGEFVGGANDMSSAVSHRTQVEAFTENPSFGASGTSRMAVAALILNHQAPPAGELTAQVTVGAAGSGTLTADGALAGTASVGAAASGTLTATGALAGAVTVGAAASATLAATGALVAQQTVGAAATGTLQATGALAAAVTVGAAGTGALTGLGALVGTSTPTVTGTGVLAGLGALAAQVTVGASVTGNLDGLSQIQGTANVGAAGSATIQATGALAGAETVGAAGTGTLTARGALVAQVTVGAAATGDLTVVVSQIAAAVTVGAAASATLTGRGALAGAETVGAAASAELTASGALAVAVTVGAIAAATLLGLGTLAGTSAPTVTGTGVLTGAGAIAGQTTVGAAATGDLVNAAEGSIAAQVTVGAAASGTLDGLGELLGTSSPTVTGTGVLTATGALAGQTTVGASTTANLDGKSQLQGNATAGATGSGTLTADGALVGTAAVGAAGTATLAGIGALAGTSSVGATGTGILSATASIAAQVTVGAAGSATLIADGELVGQTTVGATATGDLGGNMRAQITVGATASGTLDGLGALVGTATAGAVGTGTLIGRGDMAAQEVVGAAGSGTLTAAGELTGQTTVGAVGSATLSGQSMITGQTTVGVAATGTLTGTGALQGQTTVGAAASGFLDALAQVAGAANVGATGSGTLVGVGTVAGQTTVGATASGALEDAVDPIAGQTTVGALATGTLIADVAIAGQTTVGVVAKATFVVVAVPDDFNRRAVFDIAFKTIRAEPNET